MSEGSLIQNILKRFEALHQAVVDAQFWHQQYEQDIRTTYEQNLAQINSVYDTEVQTANAAKERSIQKAKDIYTRAKNEALRRYIEQENAILAQYAQEETNANQILANAAQDAQHRADSATKALGILAAEWTSPLWKTFEPTLPKSFLDGNENAPLPIPGGIRIGCIEQPDLAYPLENVPALVPLVGKGHIVIVSKGAAKKRALHLLQSIVTRLILTFPVKSARFTLIDPLGLGDNFPFKAVPDSIAGHAYSDAEDIRARMREMTEHISRVTQKYLGREHDDIESYNLAAGEVAEPYRFLCISDFPTRFDADSADRLLSVAEKGMRTGVYLIMHVNADNEMPRDFNFEALKRMATVITITPDGDSFQLAGKSQVFTPDDIPPKDLFNKLMAKVSQQAARGIFRGIPFDRIMPPRTHWWQADASQHIEAPIGRTGARDPLIFWLGERSGKGSSHALIGGRTGSGKSNLFHVLINSLALTYSPKEVEMYLVDFKEGVEFKPYADARLPHARVIAIESEREFGLSVLRKLEKELETRGHLFKSVSASDLSTYRARRGNTLPHLPRIVLIIDEFQRLFEEQDRLSMRAAQVLELLARQGRSFGIHLIMGSQSVKVAELSNATYGQFGTRIVLQSPEEDVAMLLGPNNVAAAELLERPGEVIYNDEGGRREANLPGQIARLDKSALARTLDAITSLEQEYGFQRTAPQVIFRGNEASSLEDNVQLQHLYDLDRWPTPREVKEMFELREWVSAEKPALAWLGEAIEIKPHTAAPFRRRARSNLLIVGDSEEIIFGMMGASLIGLAAFYAPGDVKFRLVDLSLKEEEWEDTCEHFEQYFDFHDVTVRERRGATELLDEVAKVVQDREARYQAGEDDMGETVFLLLGGMHRLPELRPIPDDFGGDEPSEYAHKLMNILQRGPELGVFTIAWCDSVKSFDTILGRGWLSQFDRRVALAMSENDSQYLLNDPAANRLQRYRALLRDDERSVPLEKFKPYALPASKTERERLISEYGARLRVRLGKM